MRKRRKKLRIDRILYVLLIFIILGLLIIFGIKALLNLRIYKSITKNASVKLFKQEINVWKKTIDYVNNDIDNITIKYKSNSVTMDSSKFKNGLNIKLNTYNKNIDSSLFDNVKTFYLEKNEMLKLADKIKIKLPRYLYKNEVVDIYGVKNGKNILYKESVKVKDKYIVFKTSEKYDDYFITYIKVKSISSSNNINLKVDETRKLNITINPSNATSKDLEYKYDKKIISLSNDTVKGLKKGTTTIKITSKKDKITKEINVTVNEKEKETIKEETKEEKYKLTEKDGITYVDGIMIVNKTYSLPSTYDPGELTDEFMDAFYEMQSAAKLDNINLFIASGYRDYKYQVDLYNKYVESDGKKAADTYSARPGHSEHQTGLAADINAADSSFEDTPEALWLDKNCYKYGFVIRFPKGKEDYTGYKYEPWHLRYVGKQISKKIHNAGDISLEEYYGFSSVYVD